MKKLLILEFFVFVSIQLFSQTFEFSVFNNTRIIGKNYITQKDIAASEYAFPERVHQFIIDSITGQVFAKLCDQSKDGEWLNSCGHIAVYDLKNKRLKWSKWISYNETTAIYNSSSVTFSKQNTTTCFNIEDGKKLWKIRNNIFFSDLNYNIGLGYKVIGGYNISNTLQGIDLSMVKFYGVHK